MQATLAQFLVANPYTVEAARNEFTRDDWLAYVTTAFTNRLHYIPRRPANPAKFTPENAQLAAQTRLSTMLATRHLELAAKRCRGDLPKTWKDFYPKARSMQREITFIHGPTNSGKTYQALERLKAAPSGAYLGPLRLLALEVFDRLTAAGTPTSLVTGELIQEVDGAQHTSATIEMVNLENPVELTIIDEVQMLADKERGSAWLQAILGAPAKHLILLGAESALPAIRMLAEITGEPLTEIKLDRLSPLHTSEHKIALKDAPKGSALIVFSRQAALSLANHMRSKYQRKVSVVYGALSPEVRSEQARQFREGETDILVSTDAVGMGLNLPITTIIFTTVTKYDGQAENLINHSLTCQIAGRAGRFGLHAAGLVTATNKDDLKHIQDMLAKPLAPITPPFLVSLNIEVADTIARHLETESLSKIMAFFRDSLALEPWAIPTCSQEQLALASYLDRLPLTLANKLILSNAPATEKGNLNPFYSAMVDSILRELPERLRLLDITNHQLPLEKMEAQVKTVTLYQWMHYRYPTLFPRIKEAKAMLAQLNTAISKSLSSAQGKSCNECGKSVPWNHSFGKCEACFQKGRRNYRREYGVSTEEWNGLF